jgi:hypothetical protein
MTPTNRKPQQKETMKLTELLNQRTGFTVQMARTTRETIHGNPGERRSLPANILVVLIPASNLPANSPIKYWAHPVERHPWPAETKAWAEDVGVGLHANDVALVKMPAFPVT